MHGAEASNKVGASYYEGVQWTDAPAPAKLNLRRRFWRWVTGDTERLYTYDQMREYVGKLDSNKPRPLISIDAGATFSITDAVNGKIIRYSEIDDDGGRIGKPNRSMSDGPKYYIVPEGQKLLDAIAVVLAKVRLTER